MLQIQARHIPGAPAILAPGRTPLTYGQLYQHIDRMERTLRSTGIGRRDRVAVVLPNGPELAVACLTVETCAVCAPLNPSYVAEELDRYFADLQPRALITQAGIDSPARRAAVSRGIRVLGLSTDLNAPAGLFTLQGCQIGASSHEPVSPGDVALLLPTSGTTSRPKIVPLTHVNICTSAYGSAFALTLRETDRCLNVLPLFHGHGLNATLLASLAAGASVVCTPGCDTNSFLEWLIAFRPTWYSAVPAMHQAILTHVRHTRERVVDCRLRFVRSSSAPLAPRIFAELEHTFETSVIEYYGMTETASAPIACNPLPPGKRKPGSVGIPVSLDVAIMDDGGALLSGGQTGQVVVRGASVMCGYDGDPLASQAALAGDWFKTGDLGFFDHDGYLFLTSRTQEIINRGGEKISPREVEEVLLEHPAVAEAVTFAAPHPTLGEDVASAVVLRRDAAATSNEIRQFVIGRVADFKVPRQVLIIKDLPKGATGKVKRIGLAAKLGLASRAASPPTFVAPHTPIEKMLAALWAEILQLEQVGIHESFFELGGDSLLAMEFIAHVHDTMEVGIDVARFFEAPTIAEIADQLERLIQAGPQRCSAVMRAPRDRGPQASVAQERLWKLDQALPRMPFFNILHALRLTSPVDPALLERSINEIVQRHEILRTTFAIVDHRCVQMIAPQLTVHLTVDDLRGLPEFEQESVGHQFIEAEALHSFDLARGPLCRVRLLRLADRDCLLLITMHQAICDGWSLGVLVEELTALYDAPSASEASPLAPLSIQYADFAYWQRQWRSHPEIVAQLEYWREQLRDPLPAMELVTTGPRRTIDDIRTVRRALVLPESLSNSARSFSRRAGGTLFMTLVAALKTLLHCYLSQDDLRVATLVANRNRSGTAGLIGPLANTVILRTNLGGDPSLQEVMGRVRATTIAAYAHQDLRFEDLAETLERESGLKRAALARIMITLQNASLRPVASPGRALTVEEANPDMLLPLVTVSTFDLNLMLHEGAHCVTGTCVYKPHLFDGTTIDRLLRDFQSALEQMVTQPERPISAIHFPVKEQTSSPLPRA